MVSIKFLDFLVISITLTLISRGRTFPTVKSLSDQGYFSKDLTVGDVVPRQFYALEYCMLRELVIDSKLHRLEMHKHTLQFERYYYFMFIQRLE